MLRYLSSGWNSNSNATAGPSEPFKAPSLRVQTSSDNGQNGQQNEEDDEDIPSFPMIGSIQRAASSRQPEVQAVPAFDVSPPSPSGSSEDEEDSSPPTPKVRPKPSHRPFAAESDDVLAGLALPPSTKSIPPKVRRKEALKPGHSPLDWARLCREGGDELRVCARWSFTAGPD
jgi:hypothetical protein